MTYATFSRRRDHAQRFLLITAQFTFILLGILTLLFFLQRLNGDPALTLAGHSASHEVVEAIREDMGLNHAIPVQYAIFIGKAVTLDFGISARYQQPALSLVFDRLPATLLLSFTALALAVIIGIPLGVYAAVNHRKPSGMMVNNFAGILQAIPSFWLGLILLLIFSVNLQWVSSVANLEPSPVKRVILPAITLSVFYMARLIRLVRSGLIEEMSQPYVLAAHARGLRQRVVFAHTFRNTLLPVVAFLILDLSFLMGGSVVVESVFSYSGIGEQLVHAILNRDYALVQATVFVIALLVVSINGFSNLMYRVIDPRVQATGSIR